MFKAILLSQTEDKKTRAELLDLDESRLPDRDVTVDVEYSTLNYKDALAITGRGAVVRSWPLVPGIDLAGTVSASRSADWKAGDKVVVTGWGLGENHWGGLAQKARLDAGWLLKMPGAVRHAQRDGDRHRRLHRRAVRDGAAAPRLAARRRRGAGHRRGRRRRLGGRRAARRLGYRVVASTGRPQEADYLKRLGAQRIVERGELAQAGKPLQKEVWAGVVDTVGSHTLANACAQTRFYGAVAACGLAQGGDFPTTVMPFILRGVTLYGINSVLVPNEQRREAWALMAKHLDAEGARGDGHRDRPVGSHRLRAAPARRPGARSHGGRREALIRLEADAQRTPAPGCDPRAGPFRAAHRVKDRTMTRPEFTVVRHVRLRQRRAAGNRRARPARRPAGGAAARHHRFAPVVRTDVAPAARSLAHDRRVAARPWRIGPPAALHLPTWRATSHCSPRPCS